MATYYGKKYRLLELKHCIKEILLSRKISSKSAYFNKPSVEGKMCIAMIDGSAKHGGMCDRFKAIITLYAYCKYNKIPFRIRYTHPFNIEDYLSPASYDWVLKDGEYTDNPKYTRILYMRAEHLTRRLINLKTNKQVHFYGNRDGLEQINESYFKDSKDYYTWGSLYHELFKPGPVLEERLKSIRENIGDEYNSAVFRFQNLLGDFKEYSYKAIDNTDEAEKLIVKCLDAIKELRHRHKDKPLLVTSDSVTFLKRALEIDGVCIIPGNLIHIDGNKEVPSDSFEVFLKSFLDFYMLSEASTIYRIGTSQMYPSEFPLYAAKVNDVPFESIVID